MLVVHSFLHLLGYDDETEEGFAEMVEVQNKLLKELVMKNLRLVDSFRIAVKGLKNAFLREYHIRVAFSWCCFVSVQFGAWADTSRVAVLVTFSSLVVCLE